jgi:hypothetical protein
VSSQIERLVQAEPADLAEAVQEEPVDLAEAEQAVQEVATGRRWRR